MFNFKFALLSLLILSIGLSGCTKLNKDVSKTLSIVIEPAFKEQVIDAVKYATSKNNSLEFEIKILSPDPDKRSAEIQKLRTQIMSGKGPDLYLVNCSTDGAAQMNEPLFENPYKAMQSGVFASLDKYMKKDSYWQKENYNPSFLLPGQYQERQYILPLSCHYNMLISDTVLDYTQENDTLEDWISNIKSSSDHALKNALFELDNISGNWFQPAADYNSGQIFFDKEKWSNFALEYLLFKQDYLENEKTNNTDTSSSHILISSLDDINEHTTQIDIIPDIQGKKMAAIRCFGAVSMASDYKEEAYHFLMYFLNNVIQESTSTNGMSLSANGVLGTDYPVQVSAIRTKLSFLDQSKQDLAIKAFQSLEGAYFPTEVEHFIYEEIIENYYFWEVASMADKILIVDDDPAICKLLEKVMHSNELETTTVNCGMDALSILKNHTFDLILMDIMLGDMEGFEVIKRLRNQGISTPVMIVSGCNEDYDSLYGLSLGADDYITKPFRPLVLGAKVKALIRRNKNLVLDNSDTLECGPFSYDTTTMRFYKNGEELILSSKESALLLLFMKHPQQVFTKDMIYEHVWGNTVAVDDNAIMVYINRLRGKIEDDRQNPAYILTIRGLGYRFVP